MFINQGINFKYVNREKDANLLHSSEKIHGASKYQIIMLVYVHSVNYN